MVAMIGRYRLRIDPNLSRDLHDFQLPSLTGKLIRIRGHILQNNRQTNCNAVTPGKSTPVEEHGNRCFVKSAGKALTSKRHEDE